MALSINTLESKESASSIADAKAPNSFTLTVPRLEPPRDAFTNSGMPSGSMDCVIASGLRFHSTSVTVTLGAIAMPAAAKSDLASDLSIACSDATAPLPT
ncbi:unannotated protein [freshwater metagenome]|uniref:Unannotated protein n=1 Tax=freshwater metagenome TaxID=449393 RepID=A0A6J6HYH7_9ZZZZ